MASTNSQEHVQPLLKDVAVRGRGLRPYVFGAATITIGSFAVLGVVYLSNPTPSTHPATDDDAPLRLVNFQRHDPPRRSDAFKPLSGYVHALEELRKNGGVAPKFKLPPTVKATNELLKNFPVPDSEALFAVIPGEHIEVLFEDFLATFGSTAVKREARNAFGTQEEHRFRLGVFQKNLAAIMKKNAHAQAHSTRPDHARFGITALADWTEAEFGSLFDSTIAKGPPMRNESYLKKVASAASPTGLLSYKCSGTMVVKKARSQGGCGSCWAFSTSAALRYAHFYKAVGGADECTVETGGTCPYYFYDYYMYGCDGNAECDSSSGGKCVCPQGHCSVDGRCVKPQADPDVGELSAQFLVDCDPDYNSPSTTCGAEGNGGCCGGWPSIAMQFIAKNGGQPTHADYGGYAASMGTCKDKPKAVTLDGPKTFHDEQSVADGLCEYGAMSIAVAADAVQHYAGGVIDAQTCNYPTNPINHAVELVGVDTDLNAWVVRNSWGDWWGVAAVSPYASGGGYFLMEAGANACGVLGEWTGGGPTAADNARAA